MNFFGIEKPYIREEKIFSQRFWNNDPFTLDFPKMLESMNKDKFPND